MMHIERHTDSAQHRALLGASLGASLRALLGAPGGGGLLLPRPSPAPPECR